MKNDQSLTKILRETIQLNWNNYRKKRDNTSLPSFDQSVCSFIDLCCSKKAQMLAITEAFGRLSGKPEATIQVHLPKQYTVYPYAKTVADSLKKEAVATYKTLPTAHVNAPTIAGDMPDDSALNYGEFDPVKAVRLLLKMPQTATLGILQARELSDMGKCEDDASPMVVGVMAANLLHHVFKRNPLAVVSLFDMIDGKTPQIVNVVGDDPIYITDYSDQAPAGAVKNKDGIYCLENKIIVRGI